MRSLPGGSVKLLIHFMTESLKGEPFFIIGGGSLQVKFIRKVKACGYVAHVFDYDPVCPGKKEADYFHLLSIDDMNGIYEVARQYHPVAVQTVATEMGNVTACAIGEKLGLYTNSRETALNTTDKSRMKKVFAVHGIRTAQAIEMYENSDLSVPPYPFPFIVKASDRSASRGVTFVNSQEEFEKAFIDALNESHNKIVLAEEYLPGQQYSVETISGNGEHHIVAVTEENTDGVPNFVETHHLMPARLTDRVYDGLKEFIFKILDAFEVKYGAAHIELKYHHGEWAVIEIASRMGGWRDEMAELSMGIDYLQLIVDSVLGKPLKIEPLFRKYAIVRMILNSGDWEKYLLFKQKYPNQIFYEFIHYDDQEFQAQTLMESKGWYYLVAEDDNLVNYFMQD